MKKLSQVLILSLLLVSVFGRNLCFSQTIHILSVNDIHATVEKMPALASLIDSLRQEDPELIVLSAGDNRTGNPINDRYKEPSYPMTAMMNAIGFNASAVGNHEFDSKVEGLRNQVNKSNFKYLCSNINAPDSMRLHTYPYTFLQAHGVKIAVLGTIAINSLGIPDCHPNNVIGVTFRQPNDVIPEYRWLKEQSDILLLLSHDGYKEDIITASKYPWIDVIIGGHSHTKVEGGEMHSGVMITQAVNKLKYATLSTITIKDGKVVNKEAKLLTINPKSDKEQTSHLSSLVSRLLDEFSDNPELNSVITQASTPFMTQEDLANMEMDALISETGADIAIQNGGGVRFNSFPTGPITVMDILKLDPFGNDAIMYEMTGQEIANFICNDYDIDMKQTVYVGGCTYTMQINPTDKSSKKIDILLPNGKPISKTKKYKVVTNSYAASISTSPKQDPGISLFRPCSDFVIDFLKKQPSVSYTNTHRTKIKL